MVTPRDDPSILPTWCAYVQERVKRDGISLRRACLELADRYGCSDLTVRKWVDEKLGQRQLASARQSQRRCYARLKHKRIHLRTYFRLRRNPERYLEPILSAQAELDLGTITDRLNAACEGLRFRPSTVESLLYRYSAAQREGRIRGPPIEEIVPGVWKYSSATGEYPSGFT